MFNPKSIRKEISDAVARGVFSAGELPHGPSSGSGGRGDDPEAAARLARAREKVARHFSSAHGSGSAGRIVPAGGGPGETPDRGAVPCPGGSSGVSVPDFPSVPDAAFDPIHSRGSALIPQLHLYGDPRERARQAGELLSPILGDLLDEFLRQASRAAPARWGMGVFLSLMARRIPNDLQAEIRSLARAAGVAAPRALALTLMGDFHAALGCSTIVVEPPLAAPGQLVFGRNLDFVGYGLSDVAALLTLHCPSAASLSETDEIPHATLGWCGLWGAHTGWNAAGLCLGNMQAYNPKPDSPSGPLHMLSRKTPTSWANAMLLRHCRTVREALERIERGDMTPLSPTNLMLADATGDAALVEWDIHRHRVRRPEGGRLFATNYYIHPDVRGDEVDCWRMNLLTRTFANRESLPRPFDALSMLQFLHAVNQGELTLHSVVFEPTARRVHLAAASPPSSGGEWETIPWDVWKSQANGRRNAPIAGDVDFRGHPVGGA